MNHNSSTMEQLLLKLCSTCLSEVAELRREVRELHNKGIVESCAVPGEAVKSEPSTKQIADLAANSDSSLQDFIAVEDQALRKCFLTVLQSGALAVQLQDLATSFMQTDSRSLFPLLLAELRCGAVRIVVLRNGKCLLESSETEAEVNVALEAMENPQEQECNQDASAHVCIAIFPRFKCLHWQVLEVLLQIACKYGVDPTLDLLVDLATALVKPDLKKEVIDDVAMLRLLGGTLPRICTQVHVSPQGRIHVAYRSESVPKNPSRAALNIEQQLDAAVKSLVPHTAALKELCGGAGSVSLVDTPCILLGLLGVLSLPGSVQAAGLPQDFCKELDTATLVSAVERLLTDNPVATKGSGIRELASPSKAPKADEAITGHLDHPASSQKPPPHLMSTVTDKLTVDRIAAPALTPVGSSSNSPSKTKDTTVSAEGTSKNTFATEGIGEAGTPSSPTALEAAADEFNVMTTDTFEPQGDGMVEEGKYGENSASSGEDETDLKTKLHLRFIECFKDDLEQDRQLLMSQINNLYRMRNNGKTLPYKRSGFEKLHDFLIDIPGLTLLGTGNRMQLRLLDVPRFEAFCEEIMEGREDCFIQKPQPIPQSFQYRLIELFRRAGCREMLVRNFRDSWNRHFPGEKLQCKEFGYRDIKGLLANVSIIEKVGTRTNMKYVLKADVAPEIPPAARFDAAGTPVPVTSMMSSIQHESLASSQIRPGTMALNLQETSAGPRGMFSSMGPNLLLLARRTPTGMNAPVEVPPPPPPPPPLQHVECRSSIPAASSVPFSVGPQPVDAPSSMPIGFGSQLVDAPSSVPIRFGPQPVDAPMPMSLPCRNGPMRNSAEPVNHPPPGLEVQAPSPPMDNMCSLGQGTLSVEEHRRMRRLKKQNLKPRDPNAYITSPAALTSEDRDASKEQGKFDLATIYKAKVRGDRYCMIVDLTAARVLFTSPFCESLFEHLMPLQDRDIADLIHVDDRTNFASCLMYLVLGKFTGMEPQVVKILTACGMQVASISGEQLAGCWWRIEFNLHSGTHFSGMGNTIPADSAVPCSSSSPCNLPPDESRTSDGMVHRIVPPAAKVTLVPSDAPLFL